MNTNKTSARELAQSVVATLGKMKNADVVVFPPFTYLLEVADIVKSSSVQLGAQDMYFQPDGAFTGEVSLDMLKDCGCTWVMAGHSERRHVINEPDTLINTKLLAALDAGLKVILCIGETLQQRDAGQTDSINTAQLAYGLSGVTAAQMANIVIAYEPVWAIGTGKTATTEDAQAAHKAIRNTLDYWYGAEIANAVRIQYGGSVKPDNAATLFGQNDIDGGLIGGAALKSEAFCAIVQAAAEAKCTAAVSM